MKTVQLHVDSLPMTSRRIGTREFLELTGLTQDALTELIRMDWVMPARTAQEEFLFLDNDVLRVRKYMRLCTDFELPPVAGTIIVDLLERIDVLERRMRQHSRAFGQEE